MNMTNNNLVRELKLHSPAGVEPAVFTWPSTERQVNRIKSFSCYCYLLYFQNTKKDGVFIGGDEIVKTIRLVFEGRFILFYLFVKKTIS